MTAKPAGGPDRLHEPVSSKLSFDVQFWTPDSRLEGLVSGYHLYSVALPPGERHRDVFFPAWANLRFHVAGDEWRVRIGNTVFNVPRAAVFGPTSRATFSESASGTMTGVGLTPLGWRRLTGQPAADYSDTVAPLERLLDAEATELARAAAAPAEEIKPRFDAILLRLMTKPRADEARIAAIHRYLMQPFPGGVSDMAERLGLSHRTVNRIARAAFGFGPKLLVRRARFLRSLMALRDAGGDTWASRIEDSYYDHSHFNRDAQEFLGMSPGEFLRMRKPLNEASARLRAKILGAPAQALHEPGLTGAA